MPSELLAVLILALLVVIGVAAFLAARSRRRQQLQERFGPEYDRTVDAHGDQREAERKLRDVAERRDKLELRELERGERRRYLTEWTSLQAAFVDAPGAAVADADRLLGAVMRDRGYPVDDFDSQADLIAADHPEIASNYRAAHEIARRSGEADGADTEQLRQAFVHYRALLEELLDERRHVDLTDHEQRSQAHRRR